MLGHISGAYAARVSRDLSLCSRFDFNVYSYESEWTMGAEWWTRRSKTRATPTQEVDPTNPSLSPPDSPYDEIQGVVKARASTTTVRRLISSLVMFLPSPQVDLSLLLNSRTYPSCGKAEYETYSSVWVWFPTSQAGRNPSKP